MTPIKTALVWGLQFLCYCVFFFIVDELSYHSWILEALGDMNGSTEQMDRSLTYGLTVLALAHLANIGLMLSALTYLKNKVSLATRAYISGSKLVSRWLGFFVMYIGCFIAILIPFDILWERETIINNYRFISYSTWDNIYETLTFCLPALANVLLIYLILTAINKFRAMKQKRTSELNL